MKVILATDIELNERMGALNCTINNIAQRGAWGPQTLAYDTHKESYHCLDFFYISMLSRWGLGRILGVTKTKLRFRMQVLQGRQETRIQESPR